MITEAALISLRDYVAAAFEAGTPVFPHFTLHGREHLEEVDRLALLIGGAIPALAERQERLNLLRFALLLHDFAMVDVPDEAREAYLRRLATSEIPFSDLVREVHQDEIDRCFSSPERLSFLTGLLAEGAHQLLEDAFIIARHHRLHPLESAPPHLQDLCALMRILDELDIGPRRAPLPAYQALRPRMKPVARLHWLKHICTRPIREYETFGIEERNRRRVLKLSVAVLATKTTWRLIQQEVVGKLESCLEDEGVNSILLATLQVKLEIKSEGEGLSGVASSLLPFIRDDLDSLPDGVWNRPRRSAAPDETPHHETRQPEAPALRAHGIAAPSLREFQMVAVPPERLADLLCSSGRLTVIDNGYVLQDEEAVGGVHSAPSRIYLGPANSGKTRAASEWVMRLAQGQPSQWVVLLTRLGTLPGEIRQIVLDTSAYEQNGFLLPQRAVLFLDDLPLNLPHPAALPSAVETVRTLLHWFRELPYFRQRHVIGTLRLEEVTARPDWLEILPALQEEFELLRLKPLAGEGYRKLWKGMNRGAISRSTMLGIEQFAIRIEDAFIDAVAEKPVDPEAVATFVQQSILHARTALTAANADNFQGSAVETWLAETWPILLQAHGVSARVFYSLARLLEAGLRPNSGFAMSLGPFWCYHEIFGPALCQREGQAGTDYLSALANFLKEGYAVGEQGHHVRPVPDYLLQAPHLPGVELALPGAGWFAERALRLDSEERIALAMHLGAAEADPLQPAPDHYWNIGWCLGLGVRAQHQIDSSTRRMLRETAIARLSAMDTNGAELNWVREMFALFLHSQGKEETDPDVRKRLLDQALHLLGPNSSDEFRPLKAALNLQLTDLLSLLDGPPGGGEIFPEIDAALKLDVPPDPLNGAGWALLAGSLGERAFAETDSLKREGLFDRAISTIRKAIAAEPDNTAYKHLLGSQLVHAVFWVSDPSQRAEMLDEAVSLLRAVPDAQPETLYAYGRTLSMKVDAEFDGHKRLEYLEEAVQSYRQALAADPDMSQAWTSLATGLGTLANLTTDPQRRKLLLIEAVESCRAAVRLKPDNAESWGDLGKGLGELATAETNQRRAEDLADEATEAFRRAFSMSAPDDRDLRFVIAGHVVGLLKVVDRRRSDELKKELFTMIRETLGANVTWKEAAAAFRQLADNWPPNRHYPVPRTPAESQPRDSAPIEALSSEADRSGLPASGAKSFPRVGRNEPCPCGSGLKYKKCHGKTMP